MKKCLFLVLALHASLFCLPTVSAALTPALGDTLVLTVVNHSDHILTYKSAAHTRTGNMFTLTNRDILPGASITIKATATRWSGIAGDLTFEDKKGHKNILQIRDPLQISLNRHPITFAMNNPRLLSFSASRTLNTDSQPHSLAVTHATIEIQNRLHVG